MTTNSLQMDEKAVTQKFFSPSASLNQRNASILNFLKNENDKKEFVIETVNKIGYPRWDKIITTTKKATTNSNSFGEGSDTVTSILPFVQEQDSTVKACLVINSTLDDTSYYYLCDWQYQLVAEADGNAYNQEKFAAFFMRLNKEVFDYSVFSITDSSLFNMYPQKVVQVKLEESSTTNLYEICETYTIYYFEECPYPNTEQCMNGCDHCLLCMENISWEYCTTVSGGGTVPGNPGGTTTGGGGGTGGGTGTTPPSCPSSFAQTNGCGPGWVPNTNTPTLATLFDDHIDASGLSPCRATILTGLKNLAPGNIANIINTFANTPVGGIPGGDLTTLWNWKLIEGPTTEDPDASAETQPIVINGNVTTKFNTNNLANATDLFTARTIIHESIHAYLIAYYRNDPVALTKTYPELYTYYRQQTTTSGPADPHHTIIFHSFINDIAIALRNFAVAKGYTNNNYLWNVCKDLAYGGLEGTDAYLYGLSENERQNINERNMAEKYSQPFNGLAPLGTIACP
ncbi:MAG: hypothetical protein KA319_08255 [Ferruginibacter sp.]|nr:hypothetical protein [Ferruginibacter sp.]